MQFNIDNIDGKTRRAFEEGLSHIRMAQTWDDQEDIPRKTNELKKAIKKLDKVISMAPTFDEGWVQLILAYFKIPDYGLALFLLDKAELHVPRSTSFLKTKAMILDKLGSWNQAARIYGRLHRLDGTAGFDTKQQQMLDHFIEHEDGQPQLLESEEQLHQIQDGIFAWNTSEANKATITFTNQRIICIGRKVPSHEKGIQSKKLFRRTKPRMDELTLKDELHVSLPLESIATVRKMRFYARFSLHIWDPEDNHLVILDPLESDIETTLSILGKQDIETSDVEAKICTFFLIMFVGALILSVAALL